MITEFIFSVGASLTANAVDRRLSGKQDFFIKKKIEAKVSELVVAVIEPVSQFLIKEGIPESAITQLVAEAEPNIIWLINNDQFSFSRGLDGELITKDLLSRKNYSEEITNEFPSAFETIVRSLVDLVTKTPPVFESWEKSSFMAIFSQLDDIKSTLSIIYSAMNDVASSRTSVNSDFEKLTKHRAATTALKTNIHGLRQTPVAQAELDNLFVFPEFTASESKADRNIDEDQILDGETIENFEEFLNFSDKSLKIIIQAPAGAGKTTFSNWLSSKLLTCSTRRFPIVFPLRKTLKNGPLPNLREAFYENTSTAFSDLISPERVYSWANEKKIFIIFEGLDEVSEPQRDLVVEWINAITIAYPGLISIITSRPLSTNHIDKLLDDDWYGLNILPFDTGRVVTYISRFQKHGPNIQTGAKLRDPEQLANTWLSDQTLGPLTGNPLLLSTLLIVHHMDGELPDDRSKLYDRYIDGMLGLWEINKELDSPTVPLTKNQKKKILELIAINMISLETDAASEEDVSLWIEPYLKNQRLEAGPKAVLDHLRERSGLLIGPGQYTFAHKSIGEFLIAQSCNDGIQVNHYGTRFDRWLLKDNCTKDRWTTVTFLWSGIASTSEVQSFISSLINIGEFSLSAGLILERRKFLEPVWLEKSFWECMRLLSSGFSKNEDSSAYMTMGNLVESLAPNPSGWNLNSITSITDMHSHETKLINVFFEEGLADPSDWRKFLNEVSPTIWCILSHNAPPTSDLLNARPEQIPLMGACYYIIRGYIYGYHRDVSSLKSGLEEISWLSDYCNVEVLEVIVLFDLFIIISQDFANQRSRRRLKSYTDDFMSERVMFLKKSGVLGRVEERFCHENSLEIKNYLSEFHIKFFLTDGDDKKTLRESIDEGLQNFPDNPELFMLKNTIQRIIDVNT